MMSAIRKMFRKPKPNEYEPEDICTEADATIERTKELAKSLRRQREEELFNSILPKPKHGRTQ